MEKERPKFEKVILNEAKRGITKEIYEAGAKFAELIKNYHGSCGFCIGERQEFFKPILKILEDNPANWSYSEVERYVYIGQNMGDFIIEEKTKELLSKRSAS